MTLDTLLEQVGQITLLDWLGMLSGILAVWLGIKEKVSAWPMYIVCYLSYTFISYQIGLRAFTGLNLIFIVLSLYGWLQWTRKKNGDTPERLISRTPTGCWYWMLPILIFATIGVAILLQKTGETTLPYLDAFAAVSALVAQWLLSRKYFETWFFWIVSDLIYVGLFIHAKHWPSVLLFTLFIVLAIKGLKDWKKPALATAGI